MQGPFFSINLYIDVSPLQRCDGVFMQCFYRSLDWTKQSK